MPKPETGRERTPEELRAKLEEASAWFATIDEFTTLEGFKKWAFDRLTQLDSEVKSLDEKGGS